MSDPVDVEELSKLLESTRSGEYDCICHGFAPKCQACRDRMRAGAALSRAAPKLLALLRAYEEVELALRILAALTDDKSAKAAGFDALDKLAAVKGG